MTEEELNNQRNRFGRLVPFNDHLFIGSLTYENNALEAICRYCLQQEKRLENKLTESYTENRKLCDRVYSLSEIMGSQPGSEPATTESAHPNITPLRNPNECAETWEDLFAFFNKNSNVIKGVEQAAGIPQSDVGHQSLDPVGRQVVSAQVLTAEF